MQHAMDSELHLQLAICGLEVFVRLPAVPDNLLHCSASNLYVLTTSGNVEIWCEDTMNESS
jgi:hypothetical protein